MKESTDILDRARNDRQIAVSPMAIHAPRFVAVPCGASIRQIVDGMHPGEFVLVEVDGVPVPAGQWDLVPPEKAHVLISVHLHGGGGSKNPFRTLLTIAVVVAAAVVTGGFGAGFAGGWLATGSVSAALAGAAVMTAGMLLVNAIAPIRTSTTSSISSNTSDPTAYSLSGSQNSSNPWGTVPVVLGRHKMFPPNGAAPYTEINDGEEYLNMLVVWGYSPLRVEDLKIGETPLSQFEDVEFQTTANHLTSPLTLFPTTVKQDSIGVEITATAGPTVRTAKANADRLSVDLTFSNGLVKYDTTGKRVTRTVVMDIRYREAGSSAAWTAIPTTLARYVSGTTLKPTLTAAGTYSVYVSNPQGVVSFALGTAAKTGTYRVGQFVISGGAITSAVDLAPANTVGFNLSIETIGSRQTIHVEDGTILAANSMPSLTFTDKTTSAVRRSYTWAVNRAKTYEVRVSRITADSTSDQIIDKSYWSYLRSITNDDPLASFPKALTATALRIRSSDQLNGVVDSLNGIVTSLVKVWNSETKSWGSSNVASNNPAALVRAVLMHPANPRPRTAAQIDSANLGEFYEFCETNQYAFNQIRDTQASVWDTVADVSAAGRASPSLVNGLWSIVADTGDQAVVQHITPRTSWGFSGEKTLYNRPHAFRVKFINEDNGFEDDERIVYDDGYDASNATLFEQIEFPGVTNPGQVWKFGRFHIAQARLRPETYTLSQDFEHLVVRRGSKVRVSHDIPLWGSGWGRVKSLVSAGGTVSGIVLDEKVVMEAGNSYACRFRRHSDSIVLSVAAPESGEFDELTLLTPVPEADAPAVGDLAMFGEADSETVELIVTSVQRSGDFTAQLTLVDAAPAIYSADTGTIPQFDPQTTKPIDLTTLVPNKPVIVNVESGTVALQVLTQGVIISRIFVYLSYTGAISIGKYVVRYRLLGETPWRYVETQALTVIIPSVTDGETYELQAQAVSSYGVASAWTAMVTEAVIGQSELPSDVTGFAVNIIGSQAYLSWNAVVDADLSHYRIRWSPLKSGVVWAQAVDVVKQVSASATSVTVPALVGSYLIKAVDYAGNESVTAAWASSSITWVQGLNAVETVSHPPWTGTCVGVEYDESAGGLVVSFE